MKKIIIFVLVLVALLFISDKIYQYYSRSYVNSHESIVLLNDWLDETLIDSFFNLDTGTYDSKKHKVVFSLVKKDGYLLDYYINIPTKKMFGLHAEAYSCDDEYGNMRPYRFYDYEVGKRNIVARMIDREANPIKQLNSDQTVAEKYLNVNFKYGSMNVFDVKVNGVSNHCN